MIMIGDFSPFLVFIAQRRPKARLTPSPAAAPIAPVAAALAAAVVAAAAAALAAATLPATINGIRNGRIPPLWPRLRLGPRRAPFRRRRRL